MSNRRRTFRILIFVLLGFVAALAVGSVIVSKYAFRKLGATLKASGITVRGIQVNLFTRSVILDGVAWQTSRGRDSTMIRPDSSYIRITAERISAGGINVLDFIRRKEINLGSFHIVNGTLTANRMELIRDHNAKRRDPAHDRLPFNKISIGGISVDDFEVIIRHDTLIEHQAKVHLVLKDITLNDPLRFEDPHAYSIGSLRAQIDNYHMAAQRSMYTLDVKRLTLNSEEKEFAVDSIVLIPKYGKYQFSRKVGKQIDRFVLRLPKVTLTGLDLGKVRDSIVVASRLEINRADLYVFRDKRLPFIKHHNTPLPVAMIRTLPFGFAVDTLAIEDTKITYEEFPENGFETGYIIFDHLNARLDHLANRPLYAGMTQSVLRVRSRVMKNGVIKVDFTLPYDKPQLYNAKGRISNLALSRLNPMFESLAFVRVESGRLNSLDFDFDYDDYASRGNLVLNYENLKLTGLKKEKDAGKNDLKSLALSLFVKKDKDRDVPIGKRIGKISYERDRRRAIFNIWVRSLMSGVKSSVVDSPTERKPLSRKERRDSLRHVRKEIRAQKKIDN